MGFGKECFLSFWGMVRVELVLALDVSFVVFVC